jgi:hypothetical protein
VAGLTRYISVHNWRKFQHYDPAKRTPVWIKDHLDQQDRDDYRALTFAQRGLLQNIRQAYARSHCTLRDDPAALTRRFGQRVRRRQLDALNHAGFIDFVASAALADGYQVASTEVEVEVEKKPPKSPLQQNRTSFVENEADSRPHLCPICGLAFKAQLKVDEHLYTAHDGPEPPHWLEAERQAG